MLKRPLRRRSCGERGCASYHTGRRIFIFTLRPVHLKIVSGRSLDRLGVSGSIQREAMSSAGCRFGNIGRWRAAETAPALGCVYAAALAASRIRKAPITASAAFIQPGMTRSEEHTSELQSLMRIPYASFCLKKKKKHSNTTTTTNNYN